MSNTTNQTKIAVNLIGIILVALIAVVVLLTGLAIVAATLSTPDGVETVAGLARTFAHPV